MADLFLLPFRPALDANGIIVPGAQLTFYLAGTTTKHPIYADGSLSAVLANPLSANVAGVWPSIFLDSTVTYRVVLADDNGQTLDEADPYYPGSISPDILQAAVEIASPAITDDVIAALQPDGFGYNIYYLAANGGGSGADGTKTDPWSLEWAGAVANTQRQPGDVFLMLDTGGVYPANNLFHGIADGPPIKIAAAPGHRPEISGAISGITWTLADAPTNRYRSTTSISPTTNNRQIHGFVITDGGWMTLGADRWGALTPATPAITRTNELYRTDGVFYPGPMIQALSVGGGDAGKADLRLQNASTAAMRDKLTWQVASTMPDPDLLKIFDSNTIGILVRVGNVEFQGIEINDCWSNFFMDGGLAPVENITITRCGSSRMGYVHVACGNARNLIVRYCRTNACLGARHWIGFSEVKGAGTLMEPIRKIVYLLGGHHFHSYGNTHIGAFDGMYGSGDGVEIGNYARDANGDIIDNEDAHWAFADRYIDVIDDTTQIGPIVQGFEMHHSYCFGAGVALDSAGASLINGDNFPIFHHLVCDPRRNKAFWQRAVDATDPAYATLSLEPVLRSPASFGQHGLATGGARFFPVQVYHCTFYFPADAVLSRFADFGPWFDVTPTGGLSTPFKHLCANNLIMQESPIGWIARNLFVDDGRGVWDGNLVIRPGDIALYRFTYRGGVSVGPGDGTLTYSTFYAQNGGLDYAASKVLYSVGFDTSSTLVNGSPVGAIDDAGAPLNPLAWVGAANLQAFDLPGMQSYQTWRGAKEQLAA